MHSPFETSMVVFRGSFCGGPWVAAPSVRLLGVSGASTPGWVGIARVRGESMRPTLRPGDRLLVRYGAPVGPGAIVLARFADGTLTVKRAAQRRATATGGAGWWLASDNESQG